MMRKNHLWVVALGALMSCTSAAQRDRSETANRQTMMQAWVDSVYDRMTVEERTAQLVGIRPEQVMTDGRLSLEKCRELIPHGVGHVCQYACALDLGPDELRDFVRDLQNYLLSETPSGIPAIFHEEAITGVAAKGATVYPQQLGVACTWNTRLASLKTQQTAQAMRSIGGSLALSPMVDVIRTAHWSRIEESYGEDAYLSAAMGVAFVEGLQKEGLEKGVAACSKHFLGYGGGSSLPWKEICEEVLMPHEAIIRHAGSRVVMCSYGDFRDKPVVASDTLLKEVLRGYLEFDGTVVSDYGAVNHSEQDAPLEVLKQRAVEALTAGTDIDLPSGDCYSHLPRLLRDSLIDSHLVEQAVKRSLMLKARLGLLSPDRRLYAEGHLELDPVESRQTSYELACQSVVMLKNDGVLPLPLRGQKIALVGPNANTFWCMLGDYTYQSMQAFWWGGKIDPNCPRIVTLHDALQERIGEKALLGYERGCDWSAGGESSVVRGGDPRTERLNMMLMESSDPTDWPSAIRLAAQSDVVIAALGENPTLCGEARQRKGIRLPGDQERFLKELIATGRPVVLVMFGGRPQVIAEVEAGCAAILQAWYPGEEGGNAVADLLLGRVNPSGKLSVSYPRTESTSPYCYNNGPAPEQVAYPFGYGLSYTTFAYSDMHVTPSALTSHSCLEVTCRLKNTGHREGTEVVQLYLSPASGQPLKPLQLKGFTRVSLKPGEQAAVSFKVSPQLLAHYTDGAWRVSPGDYRFCIGPSSATLPLEGVCRLTGQEISMPHREVLFSIAE